MKTNVWTLPTRIFHWYLAVGCILAYMLSDYLAIHAAIGLSIGALLLFRMIWGIVGPRYSRFKDFPISPKNVSSFARNIKSSDHLYTGHNPLASVVMLLIMLTGIGVATTGLITALSDKTELFGPARFSDLEGNFEIHELFVNILIGLVSLHLLGLVNSWLTNKDARVVQSMFNGIKKMPGINANLTIWQKGFALLAGVTTLGVLAYILSM